MGQGYQALTEKEKETLRLLISGHDAKSLARHLGLSVHTVNERLRDARRKLAVSSSREAARQLRVFESGTPEFAGDKQFRDALASAGVTGPDGTGAASDAPSRKGGQGGQRQRSGWIIGGILMTVMLALIALSPMSGSLPDIASSSQVAAPARESDSVQAARRWLALVDAEDWAGSWNATGQSFKSLNTVKRWTDASRKVRAALGPVRSREVTNVDNVGAATPRQLVSEGFVPAPPQGYQVVKFRTDYANRTGVIETVSLARESGSWRVVGITVD